MYKPHWKQILEGEWMVEFYADWCPACQKMEESWNKFGDWCTDRCKGATCNETRVGRVDITVSPFLTGKVIIEKSRSEGSLMEQDTIENIS